MSDHLPELPQATSYRYVGRNQQPAPTNQPVPLESGTDAPTHLPECPIRQGEEPCVCPELRACEDRVRTRLAADLLHDEAEAYAKGMRHARQKYSSESKVSHRDAYDRGREAGLSAAREAVAALPTQYAMEPRHVALALAAIDALKEKP